MWTHWIIITATFALAICQSKPDSQEQDATQNKKNDPTTKIIFLPEKQQLSPELQYNLGILEPQLQVPTYNLIGAPPKQLAYPRIQPQVLYYGNTPQIQPFLLNPGVAPGNFLVPQQPQPQPQPGVGPNLIFPDFAGGRPTFAAGYPKPSHIPPIEKDAEEIPTNPAKIPPLATKPKGKPEKLETFTESSNASEVEGLGSGDKNAHSTPSPPNVVSGNRFFILNGQQLFPYSLAPYNGFQQPAVLRIPQGEPLLNKPFTLSGQPLSLSGQPFYHQNPIFTGPFVPQKQQFQPNIEVPQELNDNQEVVSYQNTDGNSDSINRLPGGFSQLFTAALPLNIAAKINDRGPIPIATRDFNTHPIRIFDTSTELNSQFDDTVIIDAKASSDDNIVNSETENDSEVISAPSKSFEPSMSQAAPGAIALAGPGGVAAADPRGTALVGKGGLAVSNPQATAVAGPSRNQKESTRKPSREIEDD